MGQGPARRQTPDAATTYGVLSISLGHHHNARYQRNAVVQGLATQVGITLLYLPSYSPNLNLIERLWRLIKHRALYGQYHPTFAEFQAAIQEVLDGLSTSHAQTLKSLMTLNFQRFDDVSLMAA